MNLKYAKLFQTRSHPGAPAPKIEEGVPLLLNFVCSPILSANLHEVAAPVGEARLEVRPHVGNGGLKCKAEQARCFQTGIRHGSRAPMG